MKEQINNYAIYYDFAWWKILNIYISKYGWSKNKKNTSFVTINLTKKKGHVSFYNLHNWKKDERTRARARGRAHAYTNTRIFLLSLLDRKKDWKADERRRKIEKNGKKINK